MNYFNSITELRQKVIAAEYLVTDEEGVQLLNTPDTLIYDLMAAANHVRLHFKGEKVSLCSIINAKSGLCSEDCAFCSQSLHAKTEIPEYSLVSKEKVLESANEAQKAGAHKYGVVTSGRGIEGNDINKIEEMIGFLRENSDMHRCASLGILTKKELQELKDNGLLEYHHNLETARSFYPEICSTHKYEDNLQTIQDAKEVGLRVCCGGILGMGESIEQRIEFSLALRELDVDSIPLNFLNPIKGTKLENMQPLKPLEILKIIATFRFMHPKKDIKVAGGREVNLRQLQPFIFGAGANSMMVGNYLTTRGRNTEEDFEMMQDLQIDYCK
ncbi:MAG: biotin synthase BioB [Nitrospinae bacterium]|nr:biotin synthase BioB [Nitrospinota bacterium]